MDASARITSKGQVTIPRACGKALGLREGDEVRISLEDTRAVLAKTPDFLSPAGGGGARGQAWNSVG